MSMMNQASNRRLFMFVTSKTAGLRTHHTSPKRERGRASIWRPHEAEASARNHAHTNPIRQRAAGFPPIFPVRVIVPR